MTETRAMNARGVPKGRSIYFGTVTLTISDTDTTGTAAVVFSPKYGTEPKVILGAPTFASTGSGTYLDRAPHITSKSSTGFTVNASVDTAPGLYYDVTLTFDYIVIANARTDPAD
jgi:hypothetical protein